MAAGKHARRLAGLLAAAEEGTPDGDVAVVVRDPAPRAEARLRGPVAQEDDLGC